MTKFASLFSGIGGLDIVCKKFGWEPAWHAEVEPNATLVHAERFGNKPNYGDISQISWADIQKPDVLTAGYPCQPFSYAGSRKGEDDHRHLWPHIKQTIHILRPETILLENVPGHITKGLPTVLQDLEDVGYTTKWMQLGSSDIGGCHRRKRIWILAEQTPGLHKPAVSPQNFQPKKTKLLPTPVVDARISRRMGNRPSAGNQKNESISFTW